jgi:HTH-type transcriptional regulator, sugar sensing transcriptional regulator
MSGSPSGQESAQAALLRTLQELGFSQYEAQCYVGLLNTEPQTGYGVAKTTGVPQPKVYEALRKLVARGAAYEIAGSPTRFLPTPPATLIDRLEREVVERLDQARSAAVQLVDENAPSVDVLSVMDRWPAIVAAAARLVDGAHRRLYISASAGQLAELVTPLQAALDRGVDVVLLCFGPSPLSDSRVKVFRHLSTEGVIYRSHQARHLALIADSASTVWALANDGRTWAAIETGNQLVIAALKGFIRHDIDMQQVYDDLGPDLVARYGPGLEALERYRRDATSTAAAEEAAAAGKKGRRRTG